MIASHLRAWLTNEPWRDSYQVRFVADYGRDIFAAVAVENGRLRYERVENDPHGVTAPIDPILNLTEAEVDALLEALKQHARPVDATTDALRDTREVRDRLLALVERGWSE